MTIKCIAIDDEPLALMQIERFAQRMPGIELVGTFFSVEEARRVILRQHIDIVFLDIEMPDCNGVDFARSLGADCPCIIFTTAYPQYAVEGFRLDAVDYLLKPLDRDRMVEAVERVKRRLCADKVRGPEIYVKSSGSVHRLAVGDIMYIKGLGEYVQIFVRGMGNPVTVFDSIKHLEQQLCDHKFMRLHKSYLVNLNAVSRASRQDVVVDGVTIPVGEKYRGAFVDYLNREIFNINNH